MRFSTVDILARQSSRRAAVLMTKDRILAGIFVKQGDGTAARSPSSKAVTRSRQIAVILSGNRQSIKVAATALRSPLVRCGGLPRQLYRIVRLCAGGKFRRSSPDPDYSQACETVLSAFLPTEVATSVNLSFRSVPTIGSFRAWLMDDRPIGFHVSSFSSLRRLSNEWPQSHICFRT